MADVLNRAVIKAAMAYQHALQMPVADMAHASSVGASLLRGRARASGLCGAIGVHWRKREGRGMTEFSDVRRIVQSSLEAGAGQPSRRQVRHALGDVGSLQTIGAYIDRAMVELGPAARVQDAPRAVYESLEDDSLRRARALARRRLAEDQRTMARHLGTLIDSLRRLAPLLPAIQADLEQRARREAQARGPIPFNQQTFTPPPLGGLP